jgi:hypothetical protein
MAQSVGPEFKLQYYRKKEGRKTRKRKKKKERTLQEIYKYMETKKEIYF